MWRTHSPPAVSRSATALRPASCSRSSAESPGGGAMPELLVRPELGVEDDHLPPDLEPGIARHDDEHPHDEREGELARELHRIGPCPATRLLSPYPRRGQRSAPEIGRGA